jgi:hypothetical protein
MKRFARRIVGRSERCCLAPLKLADPNCELESGLLSAVYGIQSETSRHGDPLSH